MKFLIIFFLLTSVCFAEGIWKYDKAVKQEIDMAGKYRVWVSVIKDENTKEQIMLKFQKQPPEAQIIAEVEKVCIRMNTPEQKEPTIEELKEVIKIKDTQIEELKLQLKAVIK